MMRLKKKLTAAVLAVVMAASLAAPVFAVEGTSDQPTTTDETSVTYSVTEGYTWSVPAEITFGNDKGINQTVPGHIKDESDEHEDGLVTAITVTKNNIKYGKKLQFTAKGSGNDGEFTVETDEGAKLNYKVYEVDPERIAINPSNVVFTVAAGKTSAKALVFELTTKVGETNESEIAGEYKGKITYTASIVNAE